MFFTVFSCHMYFLSDQYPYIRHISCSATNLFRYARLQGHIKFDLLAYFHFSFSSVTTLVNLMWILSVLCATVQWRFCPTTTTGTTGTRHWLHNEHGNDDEVAVVYAGIVDIMQYARLYVRALSMQMFVTMYTHCVCVWVCVCSVFSLHTFALNSRHFGLAIWMFNQLRFPAVGSWIHVRTERVMIIKYVSPAVIISWFIWCFSLI